jgi:hypothetical protein
MGPMRCTRLAVVPLVLAAAGCGGPAYHGEAKRVDATIRAYDHADRSRHTRLLCGRLLTPHYRQSISGTVSQCATLLRRAQGPYGLSGWTHVDKSKGTMHLKERRGRWLVNGIDFTSLGA